MENIFSIHFGRAEAVDAGNRSDDDHVTAREKRGRRRMPKFVDLVVDQRFLVDERVARRDVGLRLVIVVIRNEIVDRILREQFAEFVRELGG